MLLFRYIHYFLFISDNISPVKIALIIDIISFFSNSIGHLHKLFECSLALIKKLVFPLQ